MKLFLFTLMTFVLLGGNFNVQSQSDPNWVYLESLRVEYIRGVEIIWGQMAEAGIFEGLLASVAHGLNAEIYFSGDVVLYNCGFALSRCDQNKVRHEWRPH
jgi:hypothetical protein